MRTLASSCLLIAVVAAPAWGGGFTLLPGFNTADLADLADAVADGITFPNLGGAAPSGISGFAAQVAVGGPQVDTGSGWWRRGVDSRAVAGTFVGLRGIARFALPGHLQLGGQVGQLAGERFWGGEVRWELVDGGVISPSVGVRGSYSKLSADALAVEMGELQLVVSKGFAVATPYAAIGGRRVQANANFGAPIAAPHEFRRDKFSAAVGVRMALAPLSLMGEVRQGARLGVFVGVGIGL